jgi:hypothetical protein
MAVAGPISPRTDDVPSIDDDMDDMKVYWILEDIRDEGSDTIKKLGLDVSYHGLYQEASKPIEYCGTTNSFYIVPRDTQQGSGEYYRIESTRNVRFAVENAISAAGNIHKMMSGRLGFEIWPQLQRKWGVYLDRIDRYLEVRTFHSKDETRIVIEEIESSLAAITRWPGSREASVLARDISSFFKAPNKNFRVQWLPGPDDDPKSTVDALQGFINTVDMEDLTISGWRKVRKQLQELMDYYNREIKQRQEIVVNHISNAIMALVT